MKKTRVKSNLVENENQLLSLENVGAESRKIWKGVRMERANQRAGVSHWDVDITVYRDGLCYPWMFEKEVYTYGNTSLCNDPTFNTP
ncbi:hypothetical protein OUZ56_025280 [Daphnia magna]|uniref:Uncharacterized protein n=1 Tax=Daphnia magna TaxID=35525 RepID=A0ABQ9ZJC9_9CRUS|nr:hypothetical protein OUZ56_025280 [Daphnia magna]